MMRCLSGLPLLAALLAATPVGAADTARPDDLRHYTNGTLNGSASDRLLQDMEAPVVAYENIENGLADLTARKIDTFVGDDLSLHYLIDRDYRGELTVLPMRLAESSVAFGLPQNSPIREVLNVALLEVEHEPAWQEVVSKYYQPGTYQP